MLCLQTCKQDCSPHKKVPACAASTHGISAVSVPGPCAFPLHCRCVPPPPPPPPCMEDIPFLAQEWDSMTVKCNTPGWVITQVLDARYGGVCYDADRGPSHANCSDPYSLE